MRLSRYFRNKALGGVLAAAVAGPVMGQASVMPETPMPTASQIRQLVSKGEVCAAVEDIAHPGTNVQIFLAGLFHQARIPLDEHDPVNETLTICVDAELSKKAGGALKGEYDEDADRLSFDPHFLEDVASVGVARHEMQHRTQAQKKIRVFSPVNTTPVERIILTFAAEADARTETIVWAYDMARQGHPEFIETLMDPYNAPMTRAFVASRKARPDDGPGAMRAAMYAFLNNQLVKDTYARGVIRAIKAEMEFNSRLPVEHVVSDEVFNVLGQRDNGFNYMDAALVKKLRGSFTIKDYARLDGRTVTGVVRLKAMTAIAPDMF